MRKSYNTIEDKKNKEILRISTTILLRKKNRKELKYFGNIRLTCAVA